MSIPRATAHRSANLPQEGAWPTPPSTDLAIRETFKKCGYCFLLETDSQPLSLCGRCQQISYCSRRCQREDWKAGHKEVCKEPLPPAVEAPLPSTAASLPIPSEYAEPVFDKEKWMLVFSHKPAINNPQTARNYYWDKHYANKHSNFRTLPETLTMQFAPKIGLKKDKYDMPLNAFKASLRSECPNSTSKTIKETPDEWMWQWNTEKNIHGVCDFGIIRAVRTPNGIHTFCYNLKETPVSAEIRALWIKNIKAIEIKKS